MRPVALWSTAILPAARVANISANNARPHPFLDRLDAANIETIAPAGPGRSVGVHEPFGSDSAKDGACVR